MEALRRSIAVNPASQSLLLGSEQPTDLIVTDDFNDLPHRIRVTCASEGKRETSRATKVSTV